MGNHANRTASLPIYRLVLRRHNKNLMQLVERFFERREPEH